jgi:hypothetical protein
LLARLSASSISAALLLVEAVVLFEVDFLLQAHIVAISAATNPIAITAFDSFINNILSNVVTFILQ